MNYRVGDMIFEGMEMRERDEGQGQIIIGGSRADLYAYSAENYGNGVELKDVWLTHVGDLELAAVDQVAWAEEIVAACYASVQEDTFSPSLNRKSEPLPFVHEAEAQLFIGAEIARLLKEEGFEVDYENDHEGGEMFVTVGNFEFIIRTKDFETVEEEDN